VFRDLELGQGRKAPGGPQAVVITQGAEADLAVAQLTAQVPLHSGQVVRLGGDMERIDHDLGRLIRRQGGQQPAPQLPPAVCWQQVVLQLGAQQCPGLAPEAFDHVAKVDPPQGLLTLVAMQPRQGFDVLAA
jgi:hypothetical protein